MNTKSLRAIPPFALSSVLLPRAAHQTALGSLCRASTLIHQRQYAAVANSRTNRRSTQQSTTKSQSHLAARPSAPPTDAQLKAANTPPSGHGVVDQEHGATVTERAISTGSGREGGLSSTRPALLSLPSGPQTQKDGSVTLKNRASYFYKLGRAYIDFYKTGFKNIWSNQKQYRQIRKKFHGTTDLLSAIQRGSYPSLTRQEFQMYLRTKHDLKKLLPFGLVMAICSEFTPLVVLALGTAVVPYTCRIPRQTSKDLRKTLLRIENVEQIISQEFDLGVGRVLAYVHGLDPFGISIRNLPVISPLLWRIWIQPRFRQRMENIICDGLLIKKEGGASQLEPEELEQLCITIKKTDTIKWLVAHTDGMQSPAQASEVAKHAQIDVQLFIDSIHDTLMAQGSAKTAGFQPESIFTAASLRTASAGNAPFIPRTNVDMKEHMKDRRVE